MYVSKNMTWLKCVSTQPAESTHLTSRSRPIKNGDKYDKLANSTQNTHRDEWQCGFRNPDTFPSLLTKSLILQASIGWLFIYTHTHTWPPFAIHNSLVHLGWFSPVPEYWVYRSCHHRGFASDWHSRKTCLTTASVMRPCLMYSSFQFQLLHSH